ncbi:unnamed protein product [Echinostoma caproni]|uniref:Transposase n=1 Tax=Echinostoma caproni TaxID=27848 RepID=A0A183BD61_9TREM|nr:unnamed protein product [Echinostoma caproni]
MIFEGYLFDEGTAVYTWWSDWNKAYMRELKQFVQYAANSGMHWPTLLSIRVNPVHGFINLFARIHLVFDPTLGDDTRGIPEQDAVTRQLNVFADTYDKPVKLADFHALNDSTWNEESTTTGETAEDGNEIVETDVNQHEHSTHGEQPDQLPESPEGSTIKIATAFEMVLKLSANDLAETLTEEAQPYAVLDPICYHLVLATGTIADGILADKLLGCKSSRGTDGSIRLMVYVNTGLSDSKTDSATECIRDGWAVLLEQWKLVVMEHFNLGSNSFELRRELLDYCIVSPVNLVRSGLSFTIQKTK